MAQAIDQWKKRLRRQLQLENRKFSLERGLMLEALPNLKCPFTVAEWFEAASKRGFVCAASTLYRNVSLMERAGIVRRSAAPGRRRFERLDG